MHRILRRRRVLWAAAAGATVVLVSWAGNAWPSPSLGAPQPPLPIEELKIATADGAVSFRVEMAATPAAQRRGLMFRRKLPENGGMLFLFDPPYRVAMWMKNTYVSLDMIFIDRAGRIVRIAERTEPLSETPIPAGVVVKGVLEVVAGSAERFGIREGDTILHPAFGTAEAD